MAIAGLRLLPLLLTLRLLLRTSALTANQRRAIVEKHNFYRSSPDPPAADMKALVWDSTLEELATSYAAKCIWDHNEERGFRGENLFIMSGSRLNVQLGMDDWHRERDFYNFTANSCQEGEMCGHYTQMVWAGSERIGCGEKFCEKLEGFEEGNMYILVCNYEPPGNFQGQQPFLVGEACSACPATHPCQGSLCVDPEHKESGTDSPDATSDQTPDTSSEPAPDATVVFELETYTYMITAPDESDTSSPSTTSTVMPETSPTTPTTKPPSTSTETATSPFTLTEMSTIPAETSPSTPTTKSPSTQTEMSASPFTPTEMSTIPAETSPSTPTTKSPSTPAEMSASPSTPIETSTSPSIPTETSTSPSTPTETSTILSETSPSIPTTTSPILPDMSTIMLSPVPDTAQLEKVLDVTLTSTENSAISTLQTIEDSSPKLVAETVGDGTLEDGSSQPVASSTTSKSVERVTTYPPKTELPGSSPEAAGDKAFSNDGPDTADNPSPPSEKEVPVPVDKDQPKDSPILTPTKVPTLKSLLSPTKPSGKQKKGQKDVAKQPQHTHPKTEGKAEKEKHKGKQNSNYAFLLKKYQMNSNAVSKGARWGLKNGASDGTYFGKMFYSPSIGQAHRPSCPYPCLNSQFNFPLYRANNPSPWGGQNYEAQPANNPSGKKPCKQNGYKSAVYSLYMPTKNMEENLIEPKRKRRFWR